MINEAAVKINSVKTYHHTVFRIGDIGTCSVNGSDYHCYYVAACVQENHVHKDIRNPGVGQALNCKSEVRNLMDPYVVSVRKVGTYS